MRQRDELELLRWRISFVGYVIAAVLLTLVFGFWNAQIIQSGYYQLRAEQNRIREIPLRAPRGRIYDREHRILADNRPSYNIILIRENSPHTIEQTAAMLSAGIGMSKEELLERINRKRREPKFRPIVLKDDVSVGDIAFVRAHRYELPEITVEYQPRRRYLENAAEDCFAGLRPECMKAGDHSGAVVALDPRTGEVLALVSRPAFDPNVFATRITAADWNNLITDPRKPLQNRAIQSHFSPGSVFKVFMAAAGLEAGTLNPLRTVFCPGYATFYGHTFACDKHEGHGTLSLHNAIVNSCNVFFYNVGKELGIERIFRYATMMGLGRKTGIDLPTEDAGIIPSSEWKQRVFKAKWYEGETISVAIGQGYVGITPIQAAWAMGGLTTGGRLKQPHFVVPQQLKKLGFEAREIIEEDYPIQESTVEIVSKAMWGVVNEGGTGINAKIDGFEVGGKTGTAQVASKQANLKGKEYRDNAWFVGFAPYRNPEIVVAVFTENGGWGAEAAAPVAHAVLETYYKKKTGQFENKNTRIAQK